MHTVLVADKSPSLRNQVVQLLQSVGFNCLEAESGTEAQTKIEALNPDLVIADIVLPSMNGYELCLWLKNHPQLSETPLIFYSYRDSEFDRYWGLTKGASSYLSKSFELEQLSTTICQFLNAQPLSSQRPEASDRSLEEFREREDSKHKNLQLKYALAC